MTTEMSAENDPLNLAHLMSAGTTTCLGFHCSFLILHSARYTPCCGCLATCELWHTYTLTQTPTSLFTQESCML